MQVELRKRPSLNQSVQQVGLLVKVAGLEEKWVEIKRQTVEVLQSRWTSLSETLGSQESQGLHVSRLFSPLVAQMKVMERISDEAITLNFLT